AAYRTNPHEDALERGREVAALTIATARREIRPVQAAVKLPMVVNILAGQTAAPPLADIYGRLDELPRTRPGILTASVLQGFGHVDAREIGAAVHVVADDDPGLAREVAAELADALWDARAAMPEGARSPAEAVAAAAELGARRRPAVLLDVGDNIGAGAPGDS